jgi:Ca2+-binding EF-hand superfamily protein
MRIMLITAMLILTATAAHAQFSRGGGFAMFDADGDGCITEAEYHEAVQERFEKADANDDGCIDKDEVADLREEIMKRRRRF